MHDHQPQPVRGDQLGSTGVVQGALLTPVHAADREPVRLVEEGCRPLVLGAVELDHQAEIGSVAVHRQAAALTVLAWVSA